ncbi:MAG: hypothetical protein HYU36_06720 [Planctomycetes bacterium]|nr:hypothetical protein [Planctomycetota bacterium]
MKTRHGIPLALLTVVGLSCGGGGGGTDSGAGGGGGGGGGTTGQTAAAHNQGTDCASCHTTWNLVSVHDSSSQGFNSDCMLCHGDMTSETPGATNTRGVRASSSVQGIHPLMVPYVYQASGQSTVNNTVCLHCHKSVDILGESAGDLSRQTSATDCRSCHTLAGPGKELYK